MNITKNWSRENLAWAAGLFEGEGNINTRNNQLQLSSTDEDVVRRFREVVGVGKITDRIPLANQLGSKRQWTWRICRQEHGQALIAAFWPWLGERRKLKASEYLHHMATAHEKRVRRGAANNKTKLTEIQVREILSSGDKQRWLAMRYGVTDQTISAIRKRITWRHLSGDLNL